MSTRHDFRFFERLRVRWAEVDLQQIVFNGHYLMLWKGYRSHVLKIPNTRIHKPSGRSNTTALSFFVEALR